MFFVSDFIPEQYKTQETYDIIVFFNSFLIIHCRDKYITQKICDEAGDDSLATLKVIPDWFVTSKMIKTLYTAFYADDGLLFFDEYSGDVTFCCNKMSVLSANLNNINLDNGFDEDDPDKSRINAYSVAS